MYYFSLFGEIIDSDDRKLETSRDRGEMTNEINPPFGERSRIKNDYKMFV